MNSNKEATTDTRQAAYDGLMMAYATGALDLAQSMIVATHLALNPRARTMLRQLEDIGGCLIDDCEPEPMTSCCVNACLEKIKFLETVPAPKGASGETKQEKTQKCVPYPLCQHIKAEDMDDLRWYPFVHGIRIHPIRLKGSRSRAQLIRMPAGAHVPHHGHKGTEITLVLRGSFADQSAIYTMGDMVVIDETTVHSPVADAIEGCICLSVHTAPLRFTGLLGAILNPFLR